MKVKKLFSINTFNDSEINIILQKITFFWIFSIGVMHQLSNGEHIGLMFEAGPFQIEFTFRYWKMDD